MKLTLSILLLFLTVSVTAQMKPGDFFTSPTIVLREGIYILPNTFSQDFGNADVSIKGVPGKTVITDGSTAPALLDVTMPDLNTDGVYVVYKNPIYSFGGGFAHRALSYNTAGQQVLYTQGTVLQKCNGVWSRYFTGYGFKTQGNITCTGITFSGCSFYIFSPFGKSETQKFELSNCVFENVARVISSVTISNSAQEMAFNTLQVYDVYGGFRFSEFKIQSCVFDNIYTSIVWGIPPSRSITVRDNYIADCPTAIAFFNCQMKRYNAAGQSDETYWKDKVRCYFEGNLFTRIMQTNSWTVSLIRTNGDATVRGNIFDSISPQVTLFYGGNSTFTGNVVYKLNTPTETQSTVIMVKNVDTPVNTIADNNVYAPFSPFVAVEGYASFFIQKNSGEVLTVFNKQDATDAPRQFVRIANNNMKAKWVTVISSRDTTLRFGFVETMGNTFTGLANPAYIGYTRVLNYIHL